MVYCRNIRRWVPIFRPQAQNIPSSGIRRAWGWRIVLSLEIRRACGWGVVLRLGIRCAGRIVLSLGDRRAWGWGIVLRMEIRRESMLHPKWRTENAYRGSRLDLRRNNYWARIIVLSLGDRQACRWWVVLRLGIRCAGRIVLSLGDRRAWG